MRFGPSTIMGIMVLSILASADAQPTPEQPARQAPTRATTRATTRTATAREERTREERLSFQSFAPWSPRTHLDADVAMVYGVDRTLPERIETWRKRGYRIHVMTGVSWGEYQDYLYGRFDGKNHEDEAQTDKNGNKISHGGDVYYMSPGEAYGRFLTLGVKRAIDAGAEAIHLEEPEFWVRAGYEPNFRREWKAFYGDEWQPLHSSPDAQYRASKLKYFLYRRALSQVFSFVKEYGKKIGRNIPCYVPTHSLINYAHWGIVSPESSLLEVGCDGYIAQVWTGTARTPNVYEGRLKERTFETAFLEYSAMQNLVRASGRRVWYLNDPIEDNPDHSWEDYRTNWESTLVASLLQPEVWRYEIMPWPDRIYTRDYPVKEAAQRQPNEPVQKVPISDAYETELQSVIRALGDMKQPPSKVRWEQSGTRGVGVLVSDTMMFQRGEPQSSDEHLGSFYGLAMPLLKRGLPVEPVQIESAASARNFLKPYRLLLLTYEGQKPPTPNFHKALAAWVRGGGALMVVDDDADPYHAVRDWWNTAPLRYSTPRHHLFEALRLPADAGGLQRVGKGVVLRMKLSPAALTYRADGADLLRTEARRAAAAVNLPWSESNALVLRRGPYLVASGLDESLPNAPAPVLRGRFINLFEADLPIVPEVALSAGRRALLVDLNAFPRNRAGVVAAACRVRDEVVTPRSIRFHATGQSETNAVVRLLLPRPPRAVLMNGAPLPAQSFDYADGTLRLRFPNSIDGVSIEVTR
ncbi:MAG: hypothetical protein JWN98_1987 [Abditibacteriota bacterium]|nr:hypothetical protein [Abditibacteriota bacterium]